MIVSELVEYLMTLDGEMKVNLGDSTYPTEELEKDNIHIQDGEIILY